MTSFVQLLVPDRLGGNFRWIWSSSTASNLGDGVLVAAGPLLVASITPEPFPVAMAFFAQRLPWFVFGLFAGAIVDRVDRRVLIVVVDLFRAGVLALLATSIAVDMVGLPLIYLAMFLLGSAETIADNVGSALVAVGVPKEELGSANARLFGSMMVTNQLLGPPLGAFLFAAGAMYPFGFNAICFVVAVVLILKVRLPRRPDESSAARSVKHEVIEGLRWLWHHPPVRTLAIMITAFNITFGAAVSIWVLYARQRLGLDETGFGVWLGVSAAGGVLGSLAFDSLEKRFTYAQLLRAGLILETLSHASLALTRSPFLSGAVIFMFGAHAIVWGTASTTVRQRSVPEALLGRVTSVYLIGCFGALALGALIGGALAQRWGILAPFWFAFAGSAVILLLTWKSIAYVARAADEAEPAQTAFGDAHEPVR